MRSWSWASGGQAGRTWRGVTVRRRRVVVAAAEHCLYETLGIPRNASKAEVKQAYRRLARIYHPDVNPVSLGPEHFQAISQAYEVLGDDALRQAYDLYGLAGLGQRYSQSRGRRRGEAEPGGHVRAVVGISLREAALGTERELQVSVLDGCTDCGGSGAARGSHAHDCELCRGTGEIIKSERVNAYGMSFRKPSTCPACGGRGITVSEACPRCEGHGLRRQRRRLRVRVPPGVDEDSVLRLKGCGDQGRGGAPAGDVHVRFELEAHAGMRRDGVDLHSQLELPLWDAILGGPARVETVRGLATLHIPPGTQHGATLSLPQQGLPRLGGPAASAGSHFFKVRIALPQLETLGEAELMLLSELAELQRAQQARQAGQARERGQQQAEQAQQTDQARERAQQSQRQARDEGRGAEGPAAFSGRRQAQRAEQAGQGAEGLGRHSKPPWQQEQQLEQQLEQQRRRRQQRKPLGWQQGVGGSGARQPKQRQRPPPPANGTAQQGQQPGSAAQQGQRPSSASWRGRPAVRHVVVSEVAHPSDGREAPSGEWLANLVLQLGEVLDGPSRDFDGDCE